ncbi:hypothetical protein JCM21714_126 [Gracilibacillus boraciitolerans JCM 21714]|uniref:Uncharacterized protein n=1 Tax=Gracilibacillus boraciitolerans JCM 21714 TaxID=1298598 RepID=W4VCN4_9BACI|nr:hypothetical protein JCM21714_126 [Gracilibacillus boraciitolerans JCM 21714]
MLTVNSWNICISLNGLSPELIKSRPKNNEPKPKIVNPILVSLLLFKKNSISAPTARIGKAYSFISIPIIKAVIVVPIFAPHDNTN